MTDLSQVSEGDSSSPAKLVRIALKNGAGEIEVDINRIPQHVWEEVVMQGLKQVAERNMSKLTKAAFPNDAEGMERKQAILKRATENVEAMYAGKTKITGGKAKKATAEDRAVNTEAMRLAKALVKDAMRRAKIKMKDVKASEITAAAKVFLEDDPSIIETAKANLAARAATPTPKLDIRALLKQPAAAPESEKPPLSAKQAGKPAPRAKQRPEQRQGA